jgi:hypothetical protein
MDREKRAPRDPHNWRSIIQSNTVGEMVNNDTDTSEDSDHGTRHIINVENNNSNLIEVINMIFYFKTIEF